MEQKEFKNLLIQRLYEINIQVYNILHSVRYIIENIVYMYQFEANHNDLN